MFASFLCFSLISEMKSLSKENLLESCYEEIAFDSYPLGFASPPPCSTICCFCCSKLTQCHHPFPLIFPWLLNIHPNLHQNLHTPPDFHPAKREYFDMKIISIDSHKGTRRIALPLPQHPSRQTHLRFLRSKQSSF